jgi:hypothetical protein
MIHGPRTDGTYVVEFQTAAGQSLAISIPRTETAVIKSSRRECRMGLWSEAGLLRKKKPRQRRG